ncbi:hypothetical protein WA016_01326 [Myxococcus stipitatus]
MRRLPPGPDGVSSFSRTDALLLSPHMGRQGPEVCVALLSRVTTPVLRTEVVGTLALLLRDDASLEKSLTPEWMRDIERKLETLAWEVPEPELAAMKWMVLRRKPRAIEQLSAQLTHRKSSVRVHAHRLLKNRVSREAYLELTCTLLEDAEAGHVVRAIRTLAFGGHLPAVSQMAALLHDRRNPVARAAMDALRVMGDAALPLLRRELAQSRRVEVRGDGSSRSTRRACSNSSSRPARRPAIVGRSFT